MPYQNPYLDPQTDLSRRERRERRGRPLPQAQYTPPKRRSHPVLRFILRVFLVILGLFVGVALALTIWIHQGQVEVPVVADYEHRNLQQANPEIVMRPGNRVPLYVNGRYPIAKVSKKQPGITNYLVFGIDSRGANERSARADTIIIVTVDSLRHELRMTSILRDTRVYIEDYDYQKINAAYAYGGVGLLINTINQNFDLDIQNFVMLDFWTSVAIVDAVGGVEIEVSENEIVPFYATLDEMNRLVDPDHPSEFIETPGVHLMDGKQAIAWARIRASDNDIVRTGRQRHVMEKVMDKFFEIHLADKLTFANELMKEVAFNLDGPEIMRLGVESLQLQSVDERVIPQEGHYTFGNNWEMIPMMEQVKPMLHDFIWP